MFHGRTPLYITFLKESLNSNQMTLGHTWIFQTFPYIYSNTWTFFFVCFFFTAYVARKQKCIRKNKWQEIHEIFIEGKTYLRAMQMSSFLQHTPLTPAFLNTIYCKEYNLLHITTQSQDLLSSSYMFDKLPEIDFLGVAPEDSSKKSFNTFCHVLPFKYI